MKLKVQIPQLKDPFLYFGVISIILFALLCFVSCSLESGLFLASVSEGPRSETPRTLPTQISQGETWAGKREISLLQSLFLSQKDVLLLESPDLVIVEGTSLRAAPPPIFLSSKVLGTLIGSESASELKKELIEYIVESGDTLWTIADKFDISLNTVLWANDLTKSSIIRAGQKLIILPISGMIHHVSKGDTVIGIAKRYKGKTEEIINFNGLLEEGDVFIGDILIIPNGVMPSPSIRYVAQWAPLASSYFICPIASPCRITQGLHWYNAIDFSHGKCGEPVYAAAGGTVLKVRLTTSRSRWAYEGAGNHLTILHPNGVVTFYGHLAVALVSPGEQVSQGQIIALMGGQPGSPGAGRSTGCHLHFAVHGARNPFAR